MIPMGTRVIGSSMRALYFFGQRHRACIIARRGDERIQGGTMRIARWSLLLLAALSAVCLGQTKPKLTLDEFFNYVSVHSVKMSPSGDALVVGTRRADWAQERFRNDLWLVRGSSTPILLTASGEDGQAEWSSDGQWIAFLSDRPVPWTKSSPSDDTDKPKSVTQLYVISAHGGESIPVTRGEESVHAFTWSRDSKSLYFSTRE